MKIGTVTQLWRYPVKSMAGEALTVARIGTRGIAGDRAWAVFDETRGGITGGKRIPALRGCRVRYLVEPDPDAAPPAVEITWSTGTCTSDAPDASSRLGEHLGRPVSLHALGSVGTGTAPRLTLEGESPEVVRDLMGVLPGEPMADLTGLSGEPLRRLREGNFFDAYPIHVLSRTTLETLRRVAPESDWDERRFRSNIFIEVNSGASYPEHGWIGRRVRIGGVVLHVAVGCPRCVMVTQPVDELAQDHRIMRTLVRETSHTAGIYADVVESGEVRVGDPIALLA
jgi:MOSC domain-containing protein